VPLDSVVDIRATRSSRGVNAAPPPAKGQPPTPPPPGPGCGGGGGGGEGQSLSAAVAAAREVLEEVTLSAAGLQPPGPLRPGTR